MEIRNECYETEHPLPPNISYALFKQLTLFFPVAFCYFDPSPEPPLINRTYQTLRRLSRGSRSNCHQLVMKEMDDANTVLFV
ncbi:unnamed protein product [Heligmosomoides polygyrus]|uniref:Uncharacterized protein n=1 Tax=Heligmosomoides polygyrus TaxID=6339 RepID=A0A183G5J0_HELPZ|nr:unnamed protein product [Heligmosomoides polygyrus]